MAVHVGIICDCWPCASIDWATIYWERQTLKAGIIERAAYRPVWGALATSVVGPDSAILLKSHPWCRTRSWSWLQRVLRISSCINLLLNLPLQLRRWHLSNLPVVHSIELLYMRKTVILDLGRLWLGERIVTGQSLAATLACRRGSSASSKRDNTLWVLRLALEPLLLLQRHVNPKILRLAISSCLMLIFEVRIGVKAFSWKHLIIWPLGCASFQRLGILLILIQQMILLLVVIVNLNASLRTLRV